MRSDPASALCAAVAVICANTRAGPGRDGAWPGRGLRVWFSAGCLGRGEVRRVVAPDQVGVRAASAGDPLGEELERRRGPDECRERRWQAWRLVDPQPARPGSGRRRAGRGRRDRRSLPPGSRPPARRRAPGGPGRRGAARPSRSVSRRTRPVDSSIAGRWPWRNVSRSRIVVGSHAASSIFRASSRAAGRSAPDATVMIVRQPARIAAIASAPASSVAPLRSRSRTIARVGRRDRQADRRPPRPRGSARGSRPCGTSPDPSRPWRVRAPG